MAKVAWGVSGSDIDSVDPDERGSYYMGDTPPKGLYTLRVKTAKIAEFKTGNPGITFFLVVDEPKGPKAKYNGAPVWENLTVVDTQNFKIRAFCDAIGATGADWDRTVKDSEGNITKIGKVVMADLKFKALLKVGADLKNEPRSEIDRYVPKTAAQADDAEDDDSDDDDGETPF